MLVLKSQVLMLTVLWVNCVSGSSLSSTTLHLTDLALVQHGKRKLSEKRIITYRFQTLKTKNFNWLKTHTGRLYFVLL